MAVVWVLIRIGVSARKIQEEERPAPFFLGATETTIDTIKKDT